MKLRLIAVAGLAILSIEPAFAQGKPTCDGPPDACEQLVDLTAKFSAAENKNDATALAALYTRDAVLVGEGPTLFGREAIEKAEGERFKGGHWSNHTANVIQIHVMGDMAWRFGTWSMTGPGPNQTTRKYHGYWSTVNQREDGSWRIRMETWNAIEAPPE